MGESAKELKGVLAGAAIKEEIKEKVTEEIFLDSEEEIFKVMIQRGKQPNISFFAFTAKTQKQICTLIEAGFEYITDFEDAKIFRTPKI